MTGFGITIAILLLCLLPLVILFTYFSSTTCSLCCPVSIVIFSSLIQLHTTWLLHPFSTPSTAHFLFFYAWFWFSNCYSSLLLTPFSHPFRFFVFYKLLTLLPCIDYYIQFHFLTRSSMTSSSFFNSFNCPFFIFLCLVLVLKLLFISLAYSL